MAVEDCKIESGYRRVLPNPDPCAVAWWFVRRERDGRIFARGGRCRTSKLARSLIRVAKIHARKELEETRRLAAREDACRPTGLLRS